MGRLLYLDSGTLTPVPQSPSSKKAICAAARGQLDGRQSHRPPITDEGYKLKEKAAHIPAEISATLGLSEKEHAQLSALLENTPCWADKITNTSPPVRDFASRRRIFM